MAILKKTQKDLILSPYEVHCTECGGLVKNKLFPLDNLLRQYYNGTAAAAAMENLIAMLGIGALYGAPVLPDVPPLLTKDGNTYTLSKPAPWEIDAIAANLKQFACADNMLENNPNLTAVNLNISSVVAQFYLMTGFDTIYEMLDLQHKINIRTGTPQEMKDNQALLNTYCDTFAALPYVHLGSMATDLLRRTYICQQLFTILQFAQIEANQPGKRHFANEPLVAGWRYEQVNNRNMPMELVAYGRNSREFYTCGTCCCPKCLNSIPHDFGAYRQKIVGLLGTQRTGKTTYLTALADSINEITSVTQSNGELLLADTQIIPAMAGDSQWTRIRQSTGDVGALWLYQHGFPPAKTAVQLHEAPALSFLVKKEGKEPVLYTLADIPGEAFSNDTAPPDKKLPQSFVDKIKTLLKSSTAFIMVLNSQQLTSAPQTAGDDELERDPAAVLACYEGNLPDRSALKEVQTAVVLTAADLIGQGDLRQCLNLAYDIRHLSPLLLSDEKQALVYNSYAMQNTGEAVGKYLDREFGVFMYNLQKLLTDTYGPDAAAPSAFAASSGTQHAPKYYTDVTGQGKNPEDYDPDYLKKEKMEARYTSMQKDRFGLAGPLLWILSRDGMLDTSRD